MMTRLERAKNLRAAGLTLREIGTVFGVADTTVLRWVDEEYAERCRAVSRRLKETYRGVCENCSCQTTGCNGPDSAPSLCATCYTDSIRAPHGTRSRYNAGCRCEKCRKALRRYMRSLQGKPPPNHGNSGYVNYGCRCDVCKAANSAYQRAQRLRKLAA